MKKPARTWLLVSLVIVAGIAAAAAAYLLATREQRAPGDRLDSLLSEADYSLSLGYFLKAQESLKKAMTVARGEHSLLRILKRAQRVSEDLEDPLFLFELADRAAEKIPGSRDLARVALYAAIRAQAGSEVRIRSRRARRDRQAQFLQAEAYLSGLTASLDRDAVDAELLAILSLNDRQDPLQLQRLAERFQDARIRLDAALLWMAQGDRDSALALLERLPAQSEYLEPGIYIAYDAGQTEKALYYLRSHPGARDRSDLVLLEADLSLAMNDEAEALRLYQKLIRDDPDYSWIAYLNLALLLERRGDGEAAHLFRERAFSRFPDTEPVLLAYAGSLSSRAEIPKAIELLQAYLKASPNSLPAQMMLLDLEHTATSPALYQASLWRLFNRNPDSRELCERLFRYLLGLNDLDGAGAVLSHYQAAGGSGEEPWLLDLKAALAVVKRHYAEAVGLLRKRLALQQSWRARYNLGMLLAASGQRREALGQLTEAENALIMESRSRGGTQEEPADALDYYRSRIRSRIGEQYLEVGDRAAARRECEYAIDLDRGNFHAYRLLRILEAE